MRSEPVIIFVEIIYKLSHKLKQLSVIPPLQQEYKTTFANIGFVLYHKNIPVNDLRYLGLEETAFFDWNDPWYTKFEIHLYFVSIRIGNLRHFLGFL